MIKGMKEKSLSVLVFFFDVESLPISVQLGCVHCPIKVSIYRPLQCIVCRSEKPRCGICVGGQTTMKVNV